MKTASPFRHPGVVLAMVGLCLGVGHPARAVTATGLQNVLAQVNATCTFALGGGMAFGTLTATSALAVSQADATGSLTIACTTGATYYITAGDGNNYSAGWRMANGSSQYMTYGLYSDAGRTTTFPRSGTTLAGTGTGGTQTRTAYGRVPAQTAGGFGNFTDSVTFTVTY